MGLGWGSSGVCLASHRIALHDDTRHHGRRIHADRGKEGPRHDHATAQACGRACVCETQPRTCAGKRSQRDQVRPPTTTAAKKKKKKNERTNERNTRQGTEQTWRRTCHGHMPCMHTRASDEMETVRCKECERNGKKKKERKKTTEITWTRRTTADRSRLRIRSNANQRERGRTGPSPAA